MWVPVMRVMFACGATARQVPWAGNSWTLAQSNPGLEVEDTGLAN
jgi:hypothetical protein